MSSRPYFSYISAALKGEIRERNQYLGGAGGGRVRFRARWTVVSGGYHTLQFTLYGLILGLWH
jgi:hypothetical protein